jgi:hypothetical protein
MQEKIIRVFPRRNSYTPNDDMAFFDEPGLFIPDHDEVHVCCVFTWDIERCLKLQFRWQGATDKPVLIGGPAFGDAGGDFVPGRYVKQGVTFTSRGCNNNCSFCFVPKREGKLRTLPIIGGNIMQANNFLQEPIFHRREAYDMLKSQKNIIFAGGLQASLLDDWDIDEMRGLHIRKMFFACDSDANIPIIKNTGERMLKAGFKRDQLHCYVLCGDDLAKNEARCMAVYGAGMLPFAQLYQPEQPIEYSKEWKQFHRKWSRPAYYKAWMKSLLKERAAS